MAEVHGWVDDPFGLHEHRYFSKGAPTRLVRDGGLESYDDPPDTQGPDAAVVLTAAPAVPPVAARFAAPAPTAAQPRSRRRVAIVAGAVAVIAAGIAVAVLALGGHTSPLQSPCSVLTSAQESALLRSTHLRAIGGAAPKPGQPATCVVRVLPYRAGHRISLYVSVQTKPAVFPTPLLRQYGTRVPVDGLTGYWYSPKAAFGPKVGAPVASSQYFLIVSSHGYAVSVEANIPGQAEPVDRRAVTDVLRSL